MGKRIVLGIVAHVDAGKTTLAEGLLYRTGQLRSLGRVDHEDAFLDHFALERKRGITIFSKQARFSYKDMEVVLVDTPGHVDFSPEMERTLQVLDGAILVISAGDLVTGHVETLWRLLKKYNVPVFLFVNKMDLPVETPASILKELQKKLDGACLSLEGDGYGAMETISMGEEGWMEEFLESETLSEETLREAAATRRWFPCFFGSALKLEGVDTLLEGICRYSKAPCYPAQFGARVYKIGHDEAGGRLTYLKVTGGRLVAKQTIGEEKIDFIKRFNGSTGVALGEVQAGDLCAVTGLKNTFCGQGLGWEKDRTQMVLEPVLTYQLLLDEQEDLFRAMTLLRKLEEEEPMLHLHWEPASREIHVQVMGEVQMEILKALAMERYGLELAFDKGSILYKESILEPVVGIGHYEPLRHYAEVHLRMEPLKTGEGLVFDSQVSEDDLDRNWQRLILTHLEEKEHLGVLTGAPITDMKLTLVAGRAHLKHTEGGDFRQATYRAVRQGLRKAKSCLLEPYFAFRMEVPMEAVGRSMTDITRMHGSVEPPLLEGDRYVLTGEAPVACMRDYEKELASYTGGRGRLVCRSGGYKPCHNAEEVLEQTSYDPDKDTANPDASVFCAHGAGFIVPWYQVDEYAHLEAETPLDRETETLMMESCGQPRQTGGAAGERTISLEEIDRIFRDSYNRNAAQGKRRPGYHKSAPQVLVNGKAAAGKKAYPAKKCLIVDGYNILFAWEELAGLAAQNIDSARDRLIDLMCGYQGIWGELLILVFDAYKVKGNTGSAYDHNNIHVVFTKEAQTADAYIEKTVHEMAKEYQVCVATSDRLEQMVIFGEGATRISAAEFYAQMKRAGEQLRAEYNITTV